MKSATRKLLLFVCFIFISHASAEINEYDVIIVGAGPSGIAAASHLMLYGIQNFIVLESEDRIGGRINSVEFGNAFVDLGAEFSTRDEKNVVYNLGKDFLKEGSMDFDMVYSNGQIIDKELSEELYNFVSLYEVLHRNASDPYETIGDYFLRKYNKTIIKKYETEEERLQICKDAYGTLESCVCYLEGSFDWFKPALNSPYEKSSEHVEWTLNWNGLGFKTILKLMMDNKNVSGEENITEKILLKKEVTKILWGEELKTVEVRCADGTTFKAAHLIFTPSLGVMKTNKDIFSPELDDDKNNCIEKLGFDAIFKVHAHFPQKWWPDNFTYKIFVWSEEDRQLIAEQFPTGPSKDGSSWVGNIYHIHPAANNPNVLGIWITGDVIPELETTQISDIQDGIGFALQKFFGKTYNVVAPDDFIHSTWYTNSHFHGSYSYDTPASVRLGYDCHEALARPVLDIHNRPRLLFAGEVTNPTHYSTVHGAIETGYREAQRLATLYSKDLII